MPDARRILVTGGAGFIGSALVRHLIANTPHSVLVLDALTYAGNLSSLIPVSQSDRYAFAHVDICDEPAVAEALRTFQPDIITHLAAESHVDRSLSGPKAFVDTNIVGTYSMLATALAYWKSMPDDRRAGFRFHHISTDEVFGQLGAVGAFTETTPYDPRSPYSASKAASDHLVRAWYHSYGLPVLVTNCSNNYGPYHFPEKLIPLMIIKALNGEALPIYGDGSNVRDWLYVDDHARALTAVFERGTVGESYIIGGKSERDNLTVVRTVCDSLDRLSPREDGKSYRDQISFVTDRPGHDARYAVDPAKIGAELGWQPSVTFEAGIEATVQWYLENRGWWQDILDNKYAGNRLGLTD